MSDSHLPVVNPPVAQNWCCTELKLIKLSFKWTIKNFSERPEKMGESLKSSTFADGKLKWSLRIYPQGFSGDYLIIATDLIKCNKSEVLAKLKYYILNAKSQKTIAIELPYTIYKLGGRHDGWLGGGHDGCHKFIRRDYLLNQANGLLPDDKLTIICEISVLADSVNISGQSKEVQFKVPKCKLLEDFGNLIDNKKFSDVTLSVGGREFQAHKAILAARSDVFAAMFEHEMKERRLNRVDITDVDPKVFKEMLRFIYTGKTPNLNSMANELLAAADKYALEKLKVMCEEALYENLSLKTAAKTLRLADLHSADQLKAQTMNFIKNNPNYVVETPGMRYTIATLSYLVAEIFRAAAKQLIPKI